MKYLFFNYKFLYILFTNLLLLNFFTYTCLKLIDSCFFNFIIKTYLYDHNTFKKCFFFQKKKENKKIIVSIKSIGYFIFSLDCYIFFVYFFFLV